MDAQSRTLLITLSGNDRPGVTRRLFTVLDEQPIAVLDVEQLVVRGRLILAVLVSVTGDDDVMAATRTAVRRAAADLDMDVETVPGAAEDNERRRNRIHITMLGAPLTPGAIAAAAAQIADRGGNIDRIRRIASYPVTAIEFQGSGVDVESLRRPLAEVAAHHGADIAVQEAGLDRRGQYLVVMDVDSTFIQDEVIDLLADEGSTFELKPRFARNIVTTLARLGGRPVGFVANNPGHLGGILDTKACDKASHFIALCDAFGLPLVFLIDVPGFLIGPGAERTALGRRSAKLIFELGNATVPRAAVVLRKGYGLGYFAMGGGRSFNADLSVAWPGAEICAMNVEGAVDVAYRNDYLAAPDPQARRDELITVFKNQRDALRGAEAFGIDDVIDPRHTRRRLIATFDRCAPRKLTAFPPRFRTINPM